MTTTSAYARAPAVGLVLEEGRRPLTLIVPPFLGSRGADADRLQGGLVHAGRTRQRRMHHPFELVADREHFDRQAAGIGGSLHHDRRHGADVDQLRAIAYLHQGNREAVAEALPLFHRAIELDPAFASAHGMAAWCHFWRKVNGWTEDRSRELAVGTRLARRAVELGRDDAVALTRSGHALAHLAGDLDSGIALLDRAVVLNPNLASAWFLGGFLRVWLGEFDGAIEHFERAMRLSPLDPEMYRMQAGIAMAHLLAGRLDAASSWAEKACRDLPSFLMAVSIIAASHALAGRSDQAQRAMDHLRQLDPTLRISNLKDWLPIHRPENLATFADGLRRAGLPE